DHDQVLVAEDAVHVVERLDEGMVLRQLAVGVDLDVQARGGAGEEEGCEEDREEHGAAMADDPAGIALEQVRCHFVLLLRALSCPQAAACSKYSCSPA